LASSIQSEEGEIMAEKRFLFVTEKDVQNVRENRTPLNTQKHTMWSSNVYRQCAEARNKAFNDFVAENNEFKRVPDLDCLTIAEINYWLSRFAVEVKKTNGSEYRHKVLYSLFCGLNRLVELHYPNKNLFHSAEFNSLSTSDILTILRFHFYNVNISARIHPPLKQRIPLKS
jgi:hypothetical protein